MYKILYTAIIIFWILDICNLPFMEIFDITYPINGIEWLLIHLFMPDVDSSNKKSERS